MKVISVSVICVGTEVRVEYLFLLFAASFASHVHDVESISLANRDCLSPQYTKIRKTRVRCFTVCISKDGVDK